MILENELRISNWVNITYTFGNVEKLQIRGCDLNHYSYLDDVNHLVEVKALSPIPLTSEILEKCGFNYFPNNNSYQLDTELGFSLWGRNGQIWVYDLSDGEIGEAIESLHQLQNIYFALTKTELEYKP